MKACNLLIPASGSGQRFWSQTSKILVPLIQKPLFIYSVKTALKLPWIKNIVILSNPQNKENVEKEIHALKEEYSFQTQINVILGGAERPLTVKKGVEYLAKHNLSGDILVHDAARPFATAELFTKVASALDKHPAVFPTLKVTDTLRENIDGQLLSVDRERFLKAQTPQGFAQNYKNLFLVPDKEIKKETDEMMRFEKNKLPIFAVAGEEQNIKITTLDDLLYAQFLLERRKV